MLSLLEPVPTLDDLLLDICSSKPGMCPCCGADMQVEARRRSRLICAGCGLTLTDPGAEGARRPLRSAA